MERTRDRLVAALLDQVRGIERGLLNVASRLGPMMTRRIDRHRAAAGRLAAQLHALSPVAVLGRGYALARDRSGKVLSHRADFPTGEQFTLTIADGSIAARVEES
jgi:exodeoxyribonuclease VII large subunit